MDVEETRLAVAALVMPGSTNFKAKSGFRPGPGASPGLVTATGTPDGFVHVAPFQLLLQSGRATAPGTYETALDAIKDINILSTPADPTNPRDDLIVAQQSDTFYADANSDFLVRHVVGTPAGVPVDPTVTGSPDFITLARVRVNATATTITSGNITDLRTGGHANSLTGGLHSVALGGILPVTSAAQRDALVGVYEGLTIDRADLDYAERHNGSVWRPFVSGQRLATTVSTTDSGAITTTETVVMSVTAPLVSGAIYRIRSHCAFQGSVTTDQHLARIREDTVSGTVLQQRRLGVPTTVTFYPLSIEVEFTAVSTASKTFVLTFQRTSGTGNVFFIAVGGPAYFYADYIR